MSKLEEGRARVEFNVTGDDEDESQENANAKKMFMRVRQRWVRRQMSVEQCSDAI